LRFDRGAQRLPFSAQLGDLSLGHEEIGISAKKRNVTQRGFRRDPQGWGSIADADGLPARP
jgi:hypothetical protein